MNSVRLLILVHFLGLPLELIALLVVSPIVLYHVREDPDHLKPHMHLRQSEEKANLRENRCRPRLLLFFGDL